MSNNERTFNQTTQTGKEVEDVVNAIYNAIDEQTSAETVLIALLVLSIMIQRPSTTATELQKLLDQVSQSLCEHLEDLDMTPKGGDVAEVPIPDLDDFPDDLTPQ